MSNKVTPVFPGWKIIHKIGSGTYGSVYEICRENDPEAKAAMKVVSIPQDSDEVENARGEGMDEMTITSYYESVKEEFAKEFKIMEQLAGQTKGV